MSSFSGVKKIVIASLTLAALVWISRKKEVAVTEYCLKERIFGLESVSEQVVPVLVNM